MREVIREIGCQQALEGSRESPEIGEFTQQVAPCDQCESAQKCSNVAEVEGDHGIKCDRSSGRFPGGLVERIAGKAAKRQKRDP